MVGALTLLAAMTLAGEKPESTIWRAVFLDEAPLLVEFDILIELKSIEAQRTLASEASVRAADRDGDGKMSLDEAREGGPLPTAEIPLEAMWQTADRDGDALLDAAEFQTVLATLVGPPVAITFEQPRAFATLSLESLLDRNRDKRVMPDEWIEGWKRLSRVDFDDDDTLSAAELTTLIDQGTQSESKLPSLVGQDDDKLARHLRELAERTRTERGWAGRRWGEIAEPGEPVTSERIAEWVRTAPADLVVKLRVSTQRTNYVLVEQGPARLRLGRVRRQRQQGRVEAQLANSEIEFRTVRSGYEAADSRAFLLTRARAADEDQSGELTTEEFQMVDGVLPADFATLDADGDERLTFPEITEHLDAIQRFAQLRLKLTVENIAENLFETLDTDSDRRLSPRELARRRDERSIDLRRLESRFRITAETDVINLMPQDDGGMQRDQTPIIRDQQAGPRWFRQMDRNRDGDLSWREFLGPKEAFTKLDRDGDGLIDATEAANVDAGESP